MRTPAPAIQGQYRILVIEDDQDIARMVMAFLSQAGFECRYAPDGALGIKSFRQHDPHLVLLDLMMPGMAGEQVCRTIREESTVPVMIITAKTAEESQLQGFELGADDYIIKPIQLKPMLARVMVHLRRVYQYDAATSAEHLAQTEPPKPVKVPPGWAICEDCQYMGPSQKFQNPDRRDKATMLCPHCKKTDFVVFSMAG